MDAGTQLPLTSHRVASVDGNRGFVNGASPAILALEGVLAEIARTSIPVLLIGESGTGKQMFARRIHSLSTQGGETLTKIACASMTPEGFPAELGLNGNGNSHGSSSAGAAGTVFFDEVSELDAACQRILLYALPDGEGSARPGTLAARVISATTKNLDEETRSGHFRAELFYRINGVCLRLPPLRERKEDIPMLAECFLVKHATQLGRPCRPLSSRMLQFFS